MKQCPHFLSSSQSQLSRILGLPSALIASLLLGTTSLLLTSPQASAQSAAPELSPAATTETAAKVVRWTGTLPEFAGKTVEIQFGIYENAAGGSALWTESQHVTVSSDGHYSVLLGATSNEGLPQTLFPTGVGRWVAAHPVSGSKAEPETRSLLAAVPYAFKAVDAETLAGRAAADYVTREDLKSASAVPVLNSPDALSIQSNLAVPNLAGTGSPNYLPIWTNSTTLGNSTVYETASKVGIGLTSPATTLDVNGTTTLRGTTNLPAINTSTTSTGYGSRILQFGANAWSSSSGVNVPQTFQLEALPVANNTAAPSANLSLLYGAGANTPKATGLSFAANGLVTFAAGQKFPGIITGITATSPLTGGGTSGALTIGLNTATLETTLNGKYPQLAAANNFTSTNTFAGEIIGNSLTTAYSILGNTTSGVGVGGLSTGAGAQGVHGYSSGAGSIGMYGNSVGAVNGSTYPVGVLGHSTNGYGVQGNFTANTGIGVFGYGSAISATGAIYRNNGDGAGLWGDSNISSNSHLTFGIMGTADDQYAGVFYNNSPNGSQALWAYNTASSATVGAALFGGRYGTCVINTEGDLSCSGSKSAVVPVDNNTRQVALYAVEAPENWFEDFGSGELKNGVTTVKFEPTFAQTVNVGMDYKVFLTPNGDCKGLYVGKKTTTGFEVHELGGGTSTVAFDYRIVAHRKGYETIRLADRTKERDFSKSPAMKLMEASQTAR